MKGVRERNHSIVVGSARPINYLYGLVRCIIRVVPPVNKAGKTEKEEDAGGWFAAP